MTRKKDSEFNQFDYINEYAKEHYKRFQLLLSRDKDKDIIEKLNSVHSKSAYVKELIRKDLGKR